MIAPKLQPISLTPQRVSGALKRAGFDASRKSTSAVRGWATRTEGFKTGITFPPDGSVTVTWVHAGHRSQPKRERKQIELMRNALIRDGFSVQFKHLEHTILTVRWSSADLDPNHHIGIIND